MAAEDIVEEKTNFEDGIKRWQDMEDETIASCENIIHASDNILVKTIAGIIMTDSAKHKQVLDLITDTLEGTVTLTPDELGGLSELLHNHLQLERSSISLAQDQYDISRNFVIRHMLTYLLEDEKKHAKLLQQLNDFKKKLYPYG
jgi:rubrerythrin